MKALIIGFGKMGMLHAATLNYLGAFEEVIICDSSPFVREGLKNFNPGRKVYDDYRKALAGEPISLAVIAAPNHLHFPIFSDLMEKGIHTFVEKPFVTRLEEARAAGDLALKPRAKNAKTMIGYCLRFCPTYLVAKKMLEERILGTVFRFEARMYSSDVEASQTGWRFDKSEQGSGVLLDLGSHIVDLVRFLFGMPTRVAGNTESWYSKDVTDFFHAQFFYPEFTGTVEASWSMPNVRKPTPEISVIGENGTLRTTNDEVGVFLKSARGSQPSGFKKMDITELVRPVPFDLAGPYYTEQWVEFVEAVQKGTSYRNGIQESIRDHELLDLIRKSKGMPLEVAKETR